MKIPRKPMEANVPSMAMGDIAFLLLIFFLILARVEDDSHVRWKPARATEIEQVRNARASVIINIDNKTFLNGTEIGVGQLADTLDAIIGGEADPASRAVLLKVHREATATYFDPVLEAISEAGGIAYHVLEENRTP